MNKKVKLMFLIFVILTLVVFFILLTTNKNFKTKCENFSDPNIEDIFYEINQSTLGKFERLNNEFIGIYYQLQFLDNSNYYVGYNPNNTDEYFTIIINITDVQKNALNEYIKQVKKTNSTKYIKTRMNQHNQYTYVIFSDEYSSHIDGVIRSFIYCS